MIWKVKDEYGKIRVEIKKNRLLRKEVKKF